MESEAELKTQFHSLAYGAPFGDIRWQIKTASMLVLESSLRQRGMTGQLEQ